MASRESKFPLNQWVPTTFTKGGKKRRGWVRRRIGKKGKSIYDKRTTNPHVPRGRDAPGPKREVTIKGKTFMATVPERKLPQTSVPGERRTITDRRGVKRTYEGTGGSGFRAWKQVKGTA